MPRKPIIVTRTLFGILIALISAVLFVAIVVAPFDSSATDPGALILALIVCVPLAFWLLDGPATWREVKQHHADQSSAKTREQQQETIDARDALTRQEAIHTKRTARREALTVWKMPDESLFDDSGGCDLIFGNADKDLDINRRDFVTTAEADQIFAQFISDPRLNWLVGLTHCQARADLMANIAAEQGFIFKKVWATAGDLDRGTAVSGFDGKVYVDINEAGTETIAWHFHVAPCCLTRDDQDNATTIVFDPLLFDRPVSDAAWRKRLRARGDAVNFKVTDRFVSTDPFDDNGKQTRSLNVAERNALLHNSFDLENGQTFAALSAALRGKFVDQLMARVPEDFEKFMRCYSEPAFRAWWQAAPGYDETDAILSASGYFDIPMSEIADTIKSVSPELRSHTIKTRHWKEIAPKLQQLDDAYHEHCAPGYAFPDISHWRAPNAHMLWTEQGFDFKLRS